MSLDSDSDDDRNIKVDRILDELHQLSSQEKRNITKTKQSLRDWIVGTIQFLFGIPNGIDSFLDEIQVIIEKTLGLR